MSGAFQDWSVGVVIPAQNEEQTIERCIASVIASHDACAAPARLWVVVVADACTDATAAYARRAIGERGEVIDCAPRSAGTARLLGVAAVLKHFKDVSARRIWLANTDADSHVPLDWLKLHLEHAESGTAAVAGIVHLEEHEELRAGVRDVHHQHYELRADGTHSHVHGTNLGVRADAYLDVGGFSHKRVAEDHCLWQRLKAQGWQLCSPVRSFVFTSARLTGRARGGFADTLRARVVAAHG